MERGWTESLDWGKLLQTQRWQQSSNGVRTISKTRIGSDKKLKLTPSWAVINFNKSQSDSFGNLWWLTRKINKFRNENDSQMAQSHVITISTSIPQNAVELHSLLLIQFVRHDNVDVNVSMAYQSMMMNPQAERVTRTLIDKFQSQIQNSRTWSNSSEWWNLFEVFHHQLTAVGMLSVEHDKYPSIWFSVSVSIRFCLSICCHIASSHIRELNWVSGISAQFNPNK